MLGSQRTHWFRSYCCFLLNWTLSALKAVFMTLTTPIATPMPQVSIIHLFNGLLIPSPISHINEPTVCSCCKEGCKWPCVVNIDYLHFGGRSSSRRPFGPDSLTQWPLSNDMCPSFCPPCFDVNMKKKGKPLALILVVFLGAPPPLTPCPCSNPMLSVLLRLFV